jgi:DNA-binding FadR family transcriptional regulator
MNSFSEVQEFQNSAVKVSKLSHAIADRLRSQILSGQRKPGDSLPMEADLIAQFQVSRPTLREALRILEVEGMIALSRGMRSAIVQGPSVDRAAAYAAMVLMVSRTTMSDLHQVRQLLEPSMVAALALQRDKALIETLRGHLERVKASAERDDFPAALAATNDFHSGLIRSQANAALGLIVAVLAELARDTINVLIEGFEQDLPSIRRSMDKTTKGYQRLLDFIEAGDADGARAFWQRYMERAADIMRKSGIGARKVTYRPDSF